MTRLCLALRAVADATLSFTFYSRFHRTIGGSCRIRTCDQLIKSQLLYQLS
ncbi:hypothetical protein SPAB_02774 [Salmonella enterica subsp. enterica serovar Paratyphi B str. SPB7]|uniref:Uncharacterized protein n=1 Tax=Salmonella paratyphi B (strain ATCC BAA-1250 / SPB7) TaxID=1016998 RepID=A0A6C6Z404_SALPB|nr:hypothetical protein SPAB_02774 [Salmonella enterica subsp. enterica serovar Paratyphi B str. SPB7]